MHNWPAAEEEAQDRHAKCSLGSFAEQERKNMTILRAACQLSFHANRAKTLFGFGME
jgi:hypothetical protein